MDGSIKRRALGRGLDALIPAAAGSARGTELGAAGSLLRIPIDQIRPNPFQPRQNFSAEELEALAESIREQGLLQPVVVRPAGSGYELVAGERRLRAAQRAGLTEIPATVREVDDRTALELALIENLQRADLDPIEEAQAYERLRTQFGLTQDEIASRVGKHRSTVANALRLLRLPEDIQREISAGRLTAGHARALLAVRSPEEQRRLAREFLQQGVSVRDAERRSQPTARTGLDADWQAVEDQLRRLLGTKVRLLPRRTGGGKLEIEYYSLEQLHALLFRLGLRVE
ncbi:MAG: ParB/RepB/Spo0J family partition protein [Candidatus Binatia bacterium]|nr:ParB/RepB/Spo0J family partition protein [Candidatus Binatia bacterium]